MCILYYVGPKEDKFPEHPWLMTGLEQLAHNYALEMGGKVFEKELVTPKVKMPYTISEDDRKALDAVELHTNLMMSNRKAGKADVVYPGPEDGAVAVRPVSRDTWAGVCKKSNREGSSVPAEGIVLGHESGGQSVKDASAPDTETPSVFPISELDGLKIQIATLEERIKDLNFELKDKDYTIKELKAKIAGGIA